MSQEEEKPVVSVEENEEFDEEDEETDEEAIADQNQTGRKLNKVFITLANRWPVKFRNRINVVDEGNNLLDDIVLNFVDKKSVGDSLTRHWLGNNKPEDIDSDEFVEALASGQALGDIQVLKHFRTPRELPLTEPPSLNRYNLAPYQTKEKVREWYLCLHPDCHERNDHTGKMPPKFAGSNQEMTKLVQRHILPVHYNDPKEPIYPPEQIKRVGYSFPNPQLYAYRHAPDEKKRVKKKATAKKDAPPKSKHAHHQQARRKSGRGQC